MNTKQLALLALSGSLLLTPALVRAQNDQNQESVADAARKAKADKQNPTKPPKYYDNDSLGSIKGSISVVGSSPEPPAANKTDANAPNQPADKAPVKDEAYWRKAFADANKKLSDDSKELDITEREFNLKQQQFYTDPMAALKQEYSRQDLNDAKAKIDELTATVANDKQAIADLQDQLRQAGGDPGWATPLAQPPAPDTSATAGQTPAAPPQSASPSESPTTPTPATEPAQKGIGF